MDVAVRADYSCIIAPVPEASVKCNCIRKNGSDRNDCFCAVFQCTNENQNEMNKNDSGIDWVWSGTISTSSTVPDEKCWTIQIS